MIKVAFIKQKADVFGPWASFTWDAADPRRIFKVWPGKATLWEMTCALQADWYVIPTVSDTDYIKSVRTHDQIVDALEKYTTNIIDVTQIPFQQYDLVLTFDPVLPGIKPSGPLFAYYANEHWDRIYFQSLQHPMFNYDLFLDHMLAAPSQIEHLNVAIAFPYLRAPQTVRSLINCGHKQDAVWFDWRTLTAINQSDFWNDNCTQAAKLISEKINLQVLWKPFGSTPLGIENPPKWGDGLQYLEALAGAKYYLALGRASGAGQGLCDAASAGCICFGERGRAYHGLVCHPACLCTSLSDFESAIHKVQSSSALQQEILDWQDRALIKYFVDLPMSSLERAIQLKHQPARPVSTAQSRLTSTLSKTDDRLEEIYSGSKGIEEKFKHKAVLYIGSESYDAPTITIIEGLARLGFSVYTLDKANINSWFCNKIISNPDQANFDFILSNLHWGTRWSYYERYGLDSHIKILIDGDDNPLGETWQQKYARYLQMYPTNPPDTVQKMEIQPFRWVETLGNYNPDTVFTSQKNPSDEISFYLPFGIHNEYHTLYQAHYSNERHLDITHIPGVGTARAQMKDFLNRISEKDTINGKIYNQPARSDRIVLPERIQLLAQEEKIRGNIHSYFRWGLDQAYYDVLNDTKLLVYPGVNPGAWWDSKRPWEAFANGCIVLMARPGIDCHAYPVDQVCPQTVYDSEEQMIHIAKDLLDNTQLLERLRSDTYQRACKYFSPSSIARYFLDKIALSVSAQKQGKGAMPKKSVIVEKLGKVDLPLSHNINSESPENLHISIFAMPKAFQGRNSLIQRNAILSWYHMHPRPEIALFGEEEGIADLSAEIGVRHIPKIRLNEFGTPLVNDMLERCQLLASNDVIVYVNADIILLADFIPALSELAARYSQFLMIGKRFDLKVDFTLDFEQPDWQEKIRSYAYVDGNFVF